MDQNSSDFKKLQKTWYKKLAKSGFQDIEEDEVNLYKYSNLDSVSYLLPANETYYRLAGHFLHDYKFKDIHEKMIWKYHSEGFTYRELPEKVKKVINMGRRKYFYTVKRLSNEMLTMYGLKHDKK
jgi:hypothetical protein